MMDGEVRRRLAARSPATCGCIAGWCASPGKGESRVEEIVQPIYSRWLDQSPPIETTILAGLGQVELHLVDAIADARSGVGGA